MNLRSSGSFPPISIVVTSLSLEPSSIYNTTPPSPPSSPTTTANITGRESIHPMSHDLFWRDPFSRIFWAPTAVLRSPPSSSTPMDWIETQTSYILRFNVPGFGKEDIKVQLEDGNILQVRGEAPKEESVAKDAELRVAERGPRAEFERRIAMPDDAKVEQIKAQVENGVVTVVVPKEPPPPKMKPRTIPVTSKL